MFALRTAIGMLATMATFACADSSTAGSYFQVTQLSAGTTNTKINGSQEVDLSFVIHDPDPLTNTSATCSGSWKLNGTYPTGGYVPCTDVNFGWNFVDDSFVSVNDFQLQIKHSLKDPSVGPPPYDQVTNFAQLDVANLTCVSSHSGAHKGETSCHQRKHSVLQANIWATIA